MDDLRSSGSCAAPESSVDGRADAVGAGRPGVLGFGSPTESDGSGGSDAAMLPAVRLDETPGPVDAVVPAAVFGEVAAMIRSADAFGLPRCDLEAGLAKLAGARSALDACEAQFAAELDRLDDFGDRSAAVLRRVSGCSAPAAKRVAGRGQALAQMPSVEAALSAGRITAEHADVFANAAGFAGADAVDAAAGLLAAASESNVERTRRVVDGWLRDRRKGLTPTERHERQRALRRVTISQTPEGMTKATALLDPAAGAAFKAVIDDAAQRFADADRRDTRPDAPPARTYAQCRADALAALLGLDPHRAVRRWYGEVHHRDAADIAQRSGGPAPAPLPPLAPEHITTLPASLALPPASLASTLLDGFADSGSPAQADVGEGSPAQQPIRESLRRRNQLLIVADTRAVLGDDWAACEIPGTGPIPTHVLERLACGADIFGLLFDGNGQPLWHGRKVRTVTDAQWRALIARDRRCVLCDLGPQWCEAHHIVPWKAPARGRTDIDNLALLCYRCHDQLHNSRGRLARAGPTGFIAIYGRQHE